jgi:hypothetical protein
MVKTVWANNVKEGFSESFDTSSNKPSSPLNVETTEVAEFGNDFLIGKDPDELILTSKPTPEPKTEPEPKTTLPPSEELKDAAKNMDAGKAKQVYDDKVGSVTKSIFGLHEIIATQIVSGFYDNIETSEAKNDIKILAFQIALWIILLFSSYLFTVNWWYLWVYSEFNFNFKSLIMPVLHWPMSGPFNAIQFFNYPLIGFRMDKDLKTPFIQKTFNGLLELKPILFSLLHLSIFLLLVFVPFGSTVESMMTGKGAFFTIISILSFFYFVTMFIVEEWYGKFMKCGTVIGYLILVALLIGAVVLMILFIFIACPVFTIYMLVLSCLSLVLSEHINSYNTVTQIFEEIKQVRKNDSIKNKVFNNFHTIYFFVIAFSIILYNFYSSSNFESESLIALTVLLNLMLLFIIIIGITFFVKGLIGDDGDGDGKAPIPPGKGGADNGDANKKLNTLNSNANATSAGLDTLNGDANKATDA